MAIFNEGQIIIMDPNLLEETIAEGCITIVINHLGELCTVTKLSNMVLDPSTLLKCIHMARTKTEQLQTLLQKACYKEIQNGKYNGSYEFCYIFSQLFFKFQRNLIRRI
jgi:exosome complex RNA-binding protein Rrp42 (RNase PH superfamily)